MVAGWDPANLERGSNYRTGFSEPLLVFVVFFFPLVATEGFVTMDEGHACTMALWAYRESLDTPVSGLQAALCYAQPVTAPSS